jgi:hypothetical protein
VISQWVWPLFQHLSTRHSGQQKALAHPALRNAALVTCRNTKRPRACQVDKIGKSDCNKKSKRSTISMGNQGKFPISMLLYED